MSTVTTALQKKRVCGNHGHARASVPLGIATVPDTKVILHTSLRMARDLVSSHMSHVEGNVWKAGHTAWHPRAVF